MTALLHSVARLFAAAARPSLGARVLVGLVLVGVSFGVWRLAFAGLIDGGFPLSKGGDEPRLLVSQFGLTQDTLWSLAGEDPGRRQPLATLPHAPGYGIYASASPAGRLVAYTALPPGLKSPAADSPAELWLLDLSMGRARVLASSADLLVTPVWAADARSLVFRRSSPVENAAGVFELVQVDLGGGEKVLAKAGAALFPVAFTDDGALLYTIVSPDGTELFRVSPDGSAERLAHLSNNFTRDWRLSPDGQQLAFLAPQPAPQGMVLRAMVVDLPGGAGVGPARIRAAGYGPGLEFGPAWHPDGDLTLGQLSPGQVRAAAVRLEAEGGETLTEPERGFDVPIAWSPDGRRLVVRTFEGSSPVAPGRARLEVVEEDGGRQPVELTGEIAVVGWLSDE